MSTEFFFSFFGFLFLGFNFVMWKKWPIVPQKREILVEMISLWAMLHVH
jgi:hypothetical protein